jgi:hypothetical protein
MCNVQPPSLLSLYFLWWATPSKIAGPSALCHASVKTSLQIMERHHRLIQCVCLEAYIATSAASLATKVNQF